MPSRGMLGVGERRLARDDTVADRMESAKFRKVFDEAAGASAIPVLRFSVWNDSTKPPGTRRLER